MRRRRKQIVTERSKAAFTSIDDLRLRVPRLSRAELTSLADLGALNEIGRTWQKSGDIAAMRCGNRNWRCAR